MTGTLTISADAINPPSLSANPKLQFTAANGSQPVALVYTDFDAYRPPAGIRLMGNQGGEWFEAPWIICDRYNANTISSWTSDGGSFIANYFGNGTILNNGSSSVTGTIKIRLPVTWTNTMGVYKIMLYEYNSRGSSEITVSFYNYSNSQSYYNYSYQLNGAFEGAVRIAHDGSKCCILLGDTSYTWNYPKVYVHQIFGGQLISANYFDTNFNISIITSEAGLSKVTSIPKTSMNKHDTNYIRALNKNGYYGMAIAGNEDNTYIRAPRLGIIPYSSGNPGEGMLGTEGWQFSYIYVNQTKTKRVSSGTNDLRIGSSDNAGWVYCQDICSAKGPDSAYWCIRTNGYCTFTGITSKTKITGDISGYSQSLYTNSYTSNANQGERDGTGYSADGITYWRGDSTTIGIPSRSSNAWGIMNLGMGGAHGTSYQYIAQLYVGTQAEGYISIRTQAGNVLSPWYMFYTERNANRADTNWNASTLFATAGVKSRNICIETNNSGVAGDCASEINNWNSHLYLQNHSNTYIIACRGGGNFAIGNIAADYKLNVEGDIRASSWIRTDGATGWYSQSYGGGWYMTDSTWLRAYNNKQIYTGSTSADAIHTAGGINASGRIYAGGYMENAGGLNCHGIINSSGANGFNVYAAFYGRPDNGGIEIGASDNIFGIGVHSNDHMYWWWTNSGSINSGSNKSYIMEYTGSSWSFAGNILASGGITAKTTSDMRLKSKIGKTNYSDKLMSLGLVFDYVYNDIAKSRKDKMADNKKHIGLSYQSVSMVLPTICGIDKDGYGYINYISPDFISLIAGATQLSILDIKDLYNKHKTVYEKLEDALKRIEQLEKRLGN